MKKYILFCAAATTLVLSGCVEEKREEIAANIVSHRHGELESLIFDSEFESSEYYESVRSAVLDIQVHEAIKNAIEKKTPESCDRIPDEFLKKNCRNTMLETRAISENNEKWCNEISDRIVQVACLDKIAGLKAIEVHDESLCDRISDEKARHDCTVSATLDRALANRDPQVCRSFEDDGARDFCIEEVRRKSENDKKISQK